MERTNSLALLNRRVLAGLNEGNPKWYEFLPNQDMLNTVHGRRAARPVQRRLLRC